MLRGAACLLRVSVCLLRVVCSLLVRRVLLVVYCLLCWRVLFGVMFNCLLFVVCK